MGRKIPGRKHHGVRDPEKQRRERFKKIKDKINAPPTDPDEQHVPKSLQRLIEIQNRIKSGEFFRKKNKVQPKEMFEKRPNETDHQFINRVNMEVAVVKHEAAFEKKYNVEVQKDEDGEVIGVKKRTDDPVKAMLKEARKQEKSSKKKNKKKEEEPRLTKSQKRRMKQLEKKKKKQLQNVDGFEQLQDIVSFGEQAHAPPSLTVPKKVKNPDAVPRPGKKDLLLKSMLKTGNKVIDKKGKRKDLPHALRRQLDKEQEAVIQAYRLIKGKNK